jgi:hypothetical protein
VLVVGEPRSQPYNSPVFEQAWAKFYGVSCLPLYSTIKAAAAGQTGFTFEGQRFVVLKRGWGAPKFFNLSLFRTRCEVVAELFLLEAEARGKAADTNALCRVVGLGLGVWAVDMAQARELVDAYATVAQRHRLRYVSDLQFGWFRVSDCAGIRDGELLPGTGIRVRFNKCSPADKLGDEHQGKLLVAQYAWDGGSYPGNEYWLGRQLFVYVPFACVFLVCSSYWGVCLMVQCVVSALTNSWCGDCTLQGCYLHPEILPQRAAQPLLSCRTQISTQSICLQTLLLCTPLCRSSRHI